MLLIVMVRRKIGQTSQFYKIIKTFLTSVNDSRGRLEKAADLGF